MNSNGSMNRTHTSSMPAECWYFASTLQYYNQTITSTQCTVLTPARLACWFGGMPNFLHEAPGLHRVRRVLLVVAGDQYDRHEAIAQGHRGHLRPVGQVSRPPVYFGKNIIDILCRVLWRICVKFRLY
jgi:hypothetical protein